jgi:nucleoid DNA-binding protein
MAGKKSKMKRKSHNGSKSSMKAAPKKLPSIREPLSKGSMIRAMADSTGIAKKDISCIIDTFTQVIKKHVQKGGPGKFVLPGLMKVVVVNKPARPARKGINPFTGEEVMFKAKPASRAVKIRALKKLKEMVTA